MNSRIGDIRAYVIDSVGVGGNYFSCEPGHWMVDTPLANPMSVMPMVPGLAPVTHQTLSAEFLLKSRRKTERWDTRLGLVAHRPAALSSVI